MNLMLGNRNPKTITMLLHDWQEGSQSAGNLLFNRIYGELRRIASSLLSRESQGSGLQATAVVNEVYQSLAEEQEVTWEDRQHFFNFAARVMRHYIIVEARKRKTKKRGGELREIHLEESLVLDKQPNPEDLLTLDEILNELEIRDPVLVRIVELRFFVGCTIDETAIILTLGTATVKRKWEFIKRRLYQKLTCKKTIGT